MTTTATSRWTVVKTSPASVDIILDGHCSTIPCTVTKLNMLNLLYTLMSMRKQNLVQRLTF